MAETRIALLNASYRSEATRRNFGRAVDADVRSFAANERELPNAEPFDALIVSGSGASAYAEKPWIDALEATIRETIADGTPVLGVCFGHQLLAQALGGTVEPMGEYELGYREMERRGDSVLLEGLDERFTAFATHSDEVTELPDGAELTAANDRSIQGFRLDHAFGVQFHPEYDRETAERVARGKDLPEERIEAVLEGITDESVVAAERTKALFDNFLAFVERRPVEAAADVDGRA